MGLAENEPRSAFPTLATPPKICMPKAGKRTRQREREADDECEREVPGAPGWGCWCGSAVTYLPVVRESLRHMQIHGHPTGGAQVRVVVRMRVRMRMWVRMRVRVVVVVRVDGVVHRVVLDMRRSGGGGESCIGGHRVVAQNGGPGRGHEPTAVVLHSVVLLYAIYMYIYIYIWGYICLYIKGGDIRVSRFYFIFLLFWEKRYWRGSTGAWDAKYNRFVALLNWESL